MTGNTIEELPGVGPATAEKLRDAGYSDLMAIAVESPKVLAEIVEIGESTATKSSPRLNKWLMSAALKLGISFSSGEKVSLA